MVERLFLAVPWGCLRFVIVVFPDYTHLLFFTSPNDICSYDVTLKYTSFLLCAVVKNNGQSTSNNDNCNKIKIKI